MLPLSPPRAWGALGGSLAQGSLRHRAGQVAWGQFPALLLTGWVSLGNLPSPSGLEFQSPLLLPT